VNAAGRLGAYGAVLAVVFGGAFAAAGVLVPPEAAGNWTRSIDHGPGSTTGGSEMNHASTAQTAAPSHAAADGARAASAHGVPGVGAEQGGYLLREVSAPSAIGTQGTLSFTISGPNGHPATAFEASHEKKLHLIVVRSDGTEFRHVHPVMDASGRWSLPWQWHAAGTYRVYADIVPEDTGHPLVLSRTAQVAGPYEPAEAPRVSTRDRVDGFDVRLEGDVAAGGASALSISVARDGQPVRTLEPYLGAYGHLVALRAGDLAYLHVHPDGAAPVAGEASGPAVGFTAEVPTPGRYHLYFDFQVEGQVHTADFVLTATGTDDTGTGTGTGDHGTGDNPTGNAGTDTHGGH
jgi:hypothetical protein